MAEASYPDGLLYHPEHDWARVQEDQATFGITWYAQDQLGEVVFFEMPEIGRQLRKDEPYAEVESVKKRVTGFDSFHRIRASGRMNLHPKRAAPPRTAYAFRPAPDHRVISPE